MRYTLWFPLEARMDAEQREATAQLRALAVAQDLSLADEALVRMLPVHLGHRRQALLLRDGVALTDEPALIFVPVQQAEDDDATIQRD
jgi:hypothetical protein